MNKPERNSYIVAIILVILAFSLAVWGLYFVTDKMSEAYCRANLDGQYLNACLEKGVWSD